MRDPEPDPIDLKEAVFVAALEIRRVKLWLFKKVEQKLEQDSRLVDVVPSKHA